MKLLQRYILVEMIKVFVLLLSILTVLLVFVGVFREAQQNGLGAAQIIQILPYIIPSLLPYTIPATLLLAVCVVYGRLAGDLEIIAAKSAGINPLSLMLPAFGLGAVLAVGSFALSDYVIPWSVTKMQQKISDAMEDIFLDQLREQHHSSQPNSGYTIFVKEVRGRTLILPTFLYSRNGSSTTTLQAQEATIDFDLEKQVVVLNLKRCKIDAPGGTKVEVESETRAFPLPEEAQILRPRHMELAKIRAQMNQIQRQDKRIQMRRDIEAVFALGTGDFGALSDPRIQRVKARRRSLQIDLNKMKTEISSRFSLSTSCLFFVFLGAPYSISQGKKQFLTTFFLCFLPILLLYYPVVLLMMNLGKMGDLNPTWGMWIPNAVLLIVGTRVLSRVVQH